MPRLFANVNSRTIFRWAEAGRCIRVKHERSLISRLTSAKRAVPKLLALRSVRGLFMAPPIQTVLMFTNSRMPKSASSRPYPECFTPPNGRRGSDATMPLMKTDPASISSMNFACSFASLVHAAEPSPNGVAFAIGSLRRYLDTKEHRHWSKDLFT